MSFQFDLTKVPGLIDVMVLAVEDGRDWGNRFLNDLRWKGDRNKMSEHAIYESTLWSVGTGFLTGTLGLVGIPVDLVDALYSQVKLSSTLFTIYGFNTSDESMWIIIVAAAVGIPIHELATHLGTRAAIKAIQKTMLPKPLRILMKVNHPFMIKLISKIGGKNVAKVFKVLPAIGGVVSCGVNAVMMNACGYAVLSFIKQCKASA